MIQPTDARYVVLAHGKLDVHDAKTAVCLIRYRPEAVVAVIDRERAGSRVGDVLGFGGDIPVVAELSEALGDEPDRLLIGTAPPGGVLPVEWRAELIEALDSGLDLVSGLHWQLNDDPELVARAREAQRQLIDLRAVPGDLTTPQGLRDQVRGRVILTVGSDCNVGKMTASWELSRQAEARGVPARFVATGQTGVLLASAGMAIDRVISDFVSGAAERLVSESDSSTSEPSLILVEGQGSLIHPFYSAVTLGLLHGSKPDAMILCHVCGRETVRHCPEVAIPPLPRLIEIYQEAMGWIRPAEVIGVSLATFRLDDTAARQALADAERETGLPAEDPVRFPTGALLEACGKPTGVST